MGRWLKWQTGCCKADKMKDKTWKQKQARMQVLPCISAASLCWDKQQWGWGSSVRIAHQKQQALGVVGLILTHTSLAHQKAMLMRSSGTRGKSTRAGEFLETRWMSTSLLFRKLEHVFQGRSYLFQSRIVCPEYLTLGSPVTDGSSLQREKIHCDLSYRQWQIFL